VKGDGKRLWICAKVSETDELREDGNVEAAAIGISILFKLCFWSE
jgi:hypothetical protein